MRRYEKEGICWLEFELLQGLKGVRQAFFLRQGGVSESPYSSLNVGDRVGDLKDRVYINRWLIQKVFRAHAVAKCRQTHGVDVVAVQKALHVRGDGLCTNKKKVALLTQSADCQTAVFYDPVRGVVANIHAGWRGSVANIYAKGISYLRRYYGCRPKDLLVGIGPSLGPSCAQFLNYRTELPEAFWRYQAEPNYFDFWAISRAQLEESGVLPHHIEIAGLCTHCEESDCFSYRREKVTGRHGSLIALY